jgi:RNA polymerase sigma factor (sigma-70 family)
VIQDVFYRTLKTPPAKRDDRALRAFVLTAARNGAFDLLRHRGCVPMEPMPDSPDFIDENEQIEELVFSHQEIDLLLDFIPTLPTKLGRAITLDIVYCKSRAEIATILNTTERQVQRWLNEARKRCLDLLKRAAQPRDENP